MVSILPCNHRIHTRCYNRMRLEEEGAPCPYCCELMEGFEVITRRQYKRHSLEDRKRVLEAAANDDEGDWGQMLKLLKVPRTTALNWIANDSAEPKKRGGFKAKN